MTVLDALFAIQREQDPSLCFRYSCRVGMCGTCAMYINRIPRLACKTANRESGVGNHHRRTSPPPSGTQGLDRLVGALFRAMEAGPAGFSFLRPELPGIGAHPSGIRVRAAGRGKARLYHVRRLFFGLRCYGNKSPIPRAGGDQQGIPATDGPARRGRRRTSPGRQ